MMSNAPLTGTAQAKFYGTKGTGYDNAAAELGGTFSMSNSTGNYIGWFGTTYYSVSNITATTALTFDDVTKPGDNHQCANGKSARANNV